MAASMFESEMYKILLSFFIFHRNKTNKKLKGCELILILIPIKINFRFLQLSTGFQVESDR